MCVLEQKREREREREAEYQSTGAHSFKWLLKYEGEEKKGRERWQEKWVCASARFI